MKVLRLLSIPAALLLFFSFAAAQTQESQNMKLLR